MGCSFHHSFSGQEKRLVNLGVKIHSIEEGYGFLIVSKAPILDGRNDVPGLNFGGEPNARASRD